VSDSVIDATVRVIVLPDPHWLNRDDVIASMELAGLGALDVDAPMESKSVCAALLGADISPPLVVVAHGEACQLLPAVALSLRTQHRDTAGYVLVDPDAPPSTDIWPESPVTVVSDTQADGTSLRGWQVVCATDGIPAGVAREVRRFLNA